MATTCASSPWSKDAAAAAVWLYSAQQDLSPMARAGLCGAEAMASITAVPDPPHECEVIQRMSEAYRAIER